MSVHDHKILEALLPKHWCGGRWSLHPVPMRGSYFEYAAVCRVCAEAVAFSASMMELATVSTDPVAVNRIFVAAFEEALKKGSKP